MLAYALDTDDTLVTAEDSQVVDISRTPPPSRKRVPTCSDEEPQHPRGRPVARPLQKLKALLEENNRARRQAKCASEPEAEPTHKCAEESKTDPFHIEVEKSDDEEMDEKPLTRREQLSLNPEPKAKAKAKAKAKSKLAKPEIAKAPPLDTAKEVLPGKTGGMVRRKRKAAETMLDEKASIAATRTDRVGPEPVGDAGHEHVARPSHVTNDAPPAKHAAKKGKSPASAQSPREVMNILHEDERLMFMTMDLLASTKKAEIPTKDDQSALRAYKHWVLSPYWTRNTVGLLRRNDSPPHAYCGSFTSGGTPNMSIALAAVDDFATGLHYVHVQNKHSRLEMESYLRFTKFCCHRDGSGALFLIFYYNG